MPPSAILFDLDGTLVDTIGLWTKAYLQTFRDFGMVMPEAEFLDRVYTKGAPLMDILREERRPEIERAFREKRDKQYVALLESEAVWLPHAQQVLKDLRGKTRTAIVTGSHRIYTDALDRALGIAGSVECVISCDDVPDDRGKPEPDLLLLAAKRLRVSPQDCIYIGDQEFDVGAAHAAGMPCWIIPNSVTPEGAAMRADVILEGIEEVLRQI